MAEETGTPTEGPHASDPSDLERPFSDLARLDGTAAASGAVDATRAQLARKGYTLEQIARFEESLTRDFGDPSLGDAARWNDVLARAGGKLYPDWAERIASLGTEAAFSNIGKPSNKSGGAAKRDKTSSSKPKESRMRKPSEPLRRKTVPHYNDPRIDPRTGLRREDDGPIGEPPAVPPGPTQRSPGDQPPLRYLFWLVIGAAFTGYGVNALYQMYSTPPPGGAGPLALFLALLAFVAGGYILVAVTFNLWLPTPRADKMKHHGKVSVAVFVVLIIAAIYVGLNFPRKAPETKGVTPLATTQAGLNGNLTYRLTHRASPNPTLAMTTATPRNAELQAAPTPPAEGAQRVQSPIVGSASPTILRTAEPRPTGYGYFAIDCSYSKKGGADAYYILYQDPAGTYKPHFITTNTFDESRLSFNSFGTCVLNNDGPAAAYNVVLGFGYKVFEPQKPGQPNTQIDMAKLDYSEVSIPRVAAAKSFTLRFIADIPGKDEFIAPEASCRMNVPGEPDATEPCHIRKDPGTPRNLVGSGLAIFHYREKSDCHGLVPPLVEDQGKCAAKPTR